MIELNNNDIQIFIKTMRDNSHYDFSNYSAASLKRRIARIMNENNLEIDQLIEKIKNDQAFSEKVAKRVSVCTTELFRDPELWVRLKKELPEYFYEKKQLNFWHAGCSTGEEVYSMMILLNEINLLDRSNIYATDLNQDALDKAANGEYKFQLNKNYVDNFNLIFNNAVQRNVSFEKYFTINKVKDTIKMNQFLREKPVYKKTDLVKPETPFSTFFDAIICRNVIIYFNLELQNRVISFFHRNLADNGCLIMGSNESINNPYRIEFDKRFKGFYKKNKMPAG